MTTTDSGLTDKELRENFEKANDHPHGICISTNDPSALRRRFYAIRAKLRAEGDDCLDKLSCKIMTDTEVFLIKK